MNIQNEFDKLKLLEKELFALDGVISKRVVAIKRENDLEKYSLFDFIDTETKQVILNAGKLRKRTRALRSSLNRLLNEKAECFAKQFILDKYASQEDDCDKSKCRIFILYLKLSKYRNMISLKGMGYPYWNPKRPEYFAKERMSISLIGDLDE